MRTLFGLGFNIRPGNEAGPFLQPRSPHGVVEGNGFKKLIATVAPNYPLATADCYTQQVKTATQQWQSQR